MTYAVSKKVWNILIFPIRYRTPPQLQHYRYSIPMSRNCHNWHHSQIGRRSEIASDHRRFTFEHLQCVISTGSQRISWFLMWREQRALPKCTVSVLAVGYSYLKAFKRRWTAHYCAWPSAPIIAPIIPAKFTPKRSQLCTTEAMNAQTNLWINTCQVFRNLEKSILKKLFTHWNQNLCLKDARTIWPVISSLIMHTISWSLPNRMKRPCH